MNRQIIRIFAIANCILMKYDLKIEGKFKYTEIGEGRPIIILHGLMGQLSNFDGVAEYFPKKGYKVVLPELPLYTMPILKTKVGNLAKFVSDFIDYKGYKDAILMGNSLGGHIALLTVKNHPENISGLVITGSSGLYESAMGGSYVKRHSYDYVKQKTQDVFYDPKTATKELLDDVFETVGDRGRVARTLAIAKSAIRHNMAKDLPNMTLPTCIIWGKQDSVTPPEVAVDFHELLPDSNLFWIDKCGHAAMMEHPEEFNEILHKWLTERAL